VGVAIITTWKTLKEYIILAVKSLEMCQYLFLCLARKKASRDMFKRLLAGFQASK